MNNGVIISSICEIIAIIGVIYSYLMYNSYMNGTGWYSVSSVQFYATLLVISVIIAIIFIVAIIYFYRRLVD